ncbi:hypothetical protein SAMN05216376_105344 [Mameliella alba]|uniref:vWA domain-containing protein n=1 Tax=Mameliella alba TaxID=561184 RepID=UPI000888FBDD|nr:vWA domain-containing protein [Mameliella alba]OWV48381.1 hypothetical protein CDZ96_11265 [Mameliella alba]PTR40432.1 hypothetical protein LX94_01916 [Mameliella alba]GGF44908.1 hypothetical protein GCM10011319_03430 [Mameliella alba]SDD02865.1 hypothetical protein SAMN05216376_105344 [Mameliella alba]
MRTKTDQWRRVIGVAGFTATLTLASLAHAQGTPPQDFYIEEGLCSIQQLDSLPDPQGTGGAVLTVADTQIFQTRGGNPIPTPTKVPPLTRLTCHFEAGDKVLVSSTGETPYCGWIDGDDVLAGKMSATLRTIVGGEYCGDILPMRVSEFCSRLKDMGEETAECKDASIARSVFDAKFIVDNTGLSGDASVRDLSPVEIPVYALPDDRERSGTINIFNVLLIREIARGPDGQLRYLLLSGEQPIGWVDAQAGQVWYSRLTTFFKTGGDGQVLSDFPHSPYAKPIAGVPGNLDRVATEGPEFQRYPVLQDNRQASSDNNNFLPNLRVAFIGAYCDSGGAGVCSRIDDTPPPEVFDALNKTDVLFLIDGTKSMRSYFDIVSRAVRGLARDYVGNASFRFGVAMYGDYLSPSATRLRDPMQFRYPIALQPILRGDEFSELSGVDLYIEDALKDKPEASNAALLRAAEETDWRSDAPKWIIHIADHGDRQPPSPELIEALQEANIFYAPIPVRGEAVLAASQAFLQHSNAIRNQHVSPSGKALSVEVKKTYTTGAKDEIAEFEAIGLAIRGALLYGEQLRQEAIRRAYNQTPSTGTADRSAAFPAGYSEVLEAGYEIFLKDFERSIGTNDITQRTIAAVGYVETAPVEEEEEDWSYYASLPLGVAVKLSGALNTACRGFGDGGSGELVSQAAVEMLSVLTGDPIQEGQDFEDYFRNRGSLPLATRTLFRADDLRQMNLDILNQSKPRQIDAHRRELCRSAVLVSRMVNGGRLDQPYEFDENGNRGDLVWRRDQGSYTFRNLREYDWIYTDKFGRKVYFMPLEFLPQYRKVAD